MSSNILWKSFNLCFSNFKCFPTITFSPPPPTNTDEQDQDDQTLSTTTTTTTSNNPSSIFKNFNSLYNVNYSDDLSTSKSLTFSSTTTSTITATDGDLSDEYSTVPDFTSAFASHRFFFSSPGSSNSIIEQLQPQENHPPTKGSAGAVVNDGVAVQTDSPDPFSDFRKSMVEMIEARDRTVAGDGETDWEFLNELLLCYLALNPKHTHKFIIGAFADVVVSLVLPPATPDAACRKIQLRKHCAT